MKKICLIIISVMMALLLVACGECEHSYDNACDTYCNECGESRTAPHDYEAADCETPKTCKICGATDGEPNGHTSMADDGDCTTAVTCEYCDYVFVEGKDSHKSMADDGDCTTAVTCEYCSHIITVANANHLFSSENGECSACSVSAYAMTVKNGVEAYYFSVMDAFDAVDYSDAESLATIKLFDSLTTGDVIVLNGHITLDLNGCTIETVNNNALLITNGGSLTIIDSGNGGCISGATTAISAESEASVILKGGRLENYGAGYYCINAFDNATVIIEGGTVESFEGVAVNVKSGSSLEIKGGTVIGKSYSVFYSSPKEVIISGGQIVGMIHDNKYLGSEVSVKIIGGTFPEGIELSEYVPTLAQIIGKGYDYFVDGNVVVFKNNEKSASGKITIVTHEHLYVDHVCRCGDVIEHFNQATNTYYVSSFEGLKQAFSKASSVSSESNPLTVIMIDNIDIIPSSESNIHLDPALKIEGGNVIFDLNGYQLNLISTAPQEGGIRMDDTSMTINDSRGGGKIISEADYLLDNNRGSITINGGTLETKGTYCVYAFLGVSIEINGGSFKSRRISIEPQGCENFTITGGEFYSTVSFRAGYNSIVTGGKFDSSEDIGGIVGGLSFDPETGVGAYFPGGIRCSAGNLAKMLAEGAGFFDADGNLIEVGSTDIEISGDVYVKRVENESGE